MLQRFKQNKTMRFKLIWDDAQIDAILAAIAIFNKLNFKVNLFDISHVFSISSLT